MCAADKSVNLLDALHADRAVLRQVLRYLSDHPLYAEAVAERIAALDQLLSKEDQS